MITVKKKRVIVLFIKGFVYGNFDPFEIFIEGFFLWSMTHDKDEVLVSSVWKLIET